MEVDHVPVDTKDTRGYGTKVVPGGYHEFGGRTGGMTTEQLQMYSQYQKVHGHEDFLGGGIVTGKKDYYSQRQFGAFDGMALSDHFLGNYYISVSIHFMSASIKFTTKSYRRYDFIGCIHYFCT